MRKKYLRPWLVLVGTVVLFSGVAWSAMAVLDGRVPRGVWVPSGDNSACLDQEVCVEWCLLRADGGEVPTGNFCCFPAKEEVPDDFHACRALRQ
ncbi:MAG: hypothetical protein K0U98_27225 [Deltaproteobacteria bacterium]|nr:hypothetical protein [Deltaproteobacteria bacterium]